MALRRGIGAAVAAATLVGSGWLVTTAGAAEGSATYTLLVSENSNRACPAQLDGSTVSGRVFIYISPDNGVARVRFWIDPPGPDVPPSAPPVKTEHWSRYDLAGTTPDNRAYPYDTTRLAAGPHVIGAMVTRKDGRSVWTTARFDVEQPAHDQVVLSTSPDRCSPQPLDGAVVPKKAYVFVTPASHARHVSFYLDGAVSPSRQENWFPFDLASTAPDDRARPFDTSRLTGGAHTLRVRITFADGSTEILSATFEAAARPPPPSSTTSTSSSTSAPPRSASSTTSSATTPPPATTTTTTVGPPPPTTTTTTAATTTTTVATTTTTTTAPPPPPPSGAAPFQSGNLLRLPDGTRFVAKGAAVYMYPFYDNGPGAPDQGLGASAAANFAKRDAIFAEMHSLGFNSVRVALGSGPYDRDTYHLGGKPGEIQQIKSIVSSAEKAGLYVLLGWWDSLGSGGALPSQYQQPFAMMADVRTALGDDPMVIYEPFNEPNNISWDQWQTAVQTTLRFFRNDLHYRGLMVMDTINWSWSFDPGQADRVLSLDATLLGGHSNLVFANHRYADNNTCFCDGEEASFINEVGNNVGRYPIVGTEYGFWVGLGPPHPLWNSQFLTYLSSIAVPAGLNGAWLFVWNWVDPNSMTNPDALTLNDWGESALANLITPLQGR
jgi:hypothetical protein